MRKRLLNKKGEEVLTPIIIFLVLNVLFFAILFAFSYKASTGALVYEQAYAKEIAMLIDSAEPSPSTVIRVNFEDGFRIAKSSSLNQESLLKIDDVTNQVIVNLGRSKGGYAVKYFSDYDVSYYPQANSYYIIINQKGTESNE